MKDHWKLVIIENLRVAEVNINTLGVNDFEHIRVITNPFTLHGVSHYIIIPGEWGQKYIVLTELGMYT